MKKLTILAASAAMICMTASCSSDKKRSADSIIDTIEITEETNALIDSMTAAAALPYNAEFFLDKANQGAPGDSAKWTETASGLKYTVIRQGTGSKPSADSSVTVHYAGELTDGTPFDSSYSRNEPTSFPLNGVIKGWTEGLQLMPVGSVYEFYIPYDLAYGENGNQSIPPRAPLLFKVELLSIN